MRNAFHLDFPLLYLNPHEAAVVDALASQIIPSEEGSPGAREAGVIQYIDHGLAGFLRELQPAYRHGLKMLADFTRKTYGAAFCDISEDQQREVLDKIEEQAEDHPLVIFLRIVREHTVQGFFGDPVYGGNRDSVGWKLIGYPGAQWGFTPEQMRPGFDSKNIPIATVSDLFKRMGDDR